MESQPQTYEAMFVMDAAMGTPDAARKPIETLFGRAEANVLALKPWDERRLCYEIAGRKRGLYMLAYFTMAPDRVEEFENDCQLNDDVLRVLVLRREDLTDEELQAETPAMMAATSAAARSEDGAGESDVTPSSGEAVPAANTSTDSEKSTSDEADSTSEGSAETSENDNSDDDSKTND